MNGEVIKKDRLKIPEPGLFGMRDLISPVPAAKGVERNDCPGPDRVDTGDAKAATGGRVTELEGAEPEIGRVEAL